MRFASEDSSCGGQCNPSQRPLDPRVPCYLCLLNLMLEHLGPATMSTRCAARWIGFSTRLEP